MKGISTVIATLLMLIITIALAGLAYSYISGLFTAKTGKVVEIDDGATYCTGTTLKVYIKNSGTIDFTSNKVNIAKQGQTPAACTVAATNVVAGGAAVACADYTTGVTQGNNIVVASAVDSSGPTNTVRVNEFCP